MPGVTGDCVVAVEQLPDGLRKHQFNNIQGSCAGRNSRQVDAARVLDKVGLGGGLDGEQVAELPLRVVDDRLAAVGRRAVLALQAQLQTLVACDEGAPLERIALGQRAADRGEPALLVCGDVPVFIDFLPI